MSFTKLPFELIVKIYGYLDDHIDFISLTTTCQKSVEITKHENFWSYICKIHNLDLDSKQEHFQIAKRYLMQPWSNIYKSEHINVSGCIASRSCSTGENSSILGKKHVCPNSTICFEIISVGNWLSVGVTTKALKLENESVVGYQGVADIGFYYHITTNTRLSYNDLILKEFQIQFRTGDKIKIVCNKHKLCFYYNENMLHEFVFHNIILDRFTWYPCASLSNGSAVKLI